MSLPNISIKRAPDPEAQGIIEPEDRRWQLLIDKDGCPHLYVEVPVELDDGSTGKGMFAIEDMLPDGVTIPDLMNEGRFEGKPDPSEIPELTRQFFVDRRIPCPRL